MPDEAAAGWSAVVFARNEAASIGRCVQALAEAGHGHPLHVTILLNGTSDDSAARATSALRATGQAGAIYTIAEPDKSNAVNQFLHRLRPQAGTYFFVDGYAAVAPDALRRLDQALRDHPAALAAAAVPSSGRSAARLRAAMIRAPGLHGSLFALRGSFVERIKAMGLRLPRRLYRGDGLIGSFVLHDLDATAGGWVPERIVVAADATWHAPGLRPWHWGDLRRHARRLVQQGRGRLQNAALIDAIYPAGFAGLPEDADARTLQWIAADPERRRPRLWRDPAAALALMRMRADASGLDPNPNLFSTVAAR
jgi:hypothetical protein